MEKYILLAFVIYALYELGKNSILARITLITTVGITLIRWGV